LLTKASERSIIDNIVGPVSGTGNHHPETSRV
jgi:hypothetical protein